MPRRLLIIFSFSFIFSGCWFSARQKPMPLNDPEFAAPVQKPLKFSAPKKVKWNVVSADSIRRGRIHPFDLSKLPSQPFNPPGFEPLPKAPMAKPFHYDQLPDTLLNFDRIPSRPLLSRSFLIGNIKKTNVSFPRLRAESYHTFFQYGDEQGLPGQSVVSLLNTRNGSWWIGTNGGLCILNGESLEVLPYNYGPIYFMVEDSVGRIWMTTRNNGLFVIDRKTGMQQQFPDLNSLIEVIIDKKGFIWVTSFKNGVYLIDPDRKSFKLISKKYGLSSDECIRVLEDRNGRMWIRNPDTGIDVLDPSEKKIKRLEREITPGYRYIESFMESPEGDMYVGGLHRGIDIFNINKQTHSYLDNLPGFNHDEIFNIVQDEHKRLWITSDSGGVKILSRNADSIAHIGVEEGLVAGINFDLRKGSQQNFFLSSTVAGLNIFPAAKDIAHHLSKRDGLLDDDVWALLEDSKNRIWLGTYSGVNIITPDGKISRFRAGDPEFKNERVDAILQTGPDQFALAGRGSGLTLIDESKHSYRKIGLREGLPSLNLYSIFQDSKGLIWISSRDAGLFVYDPINETIRILNQVSGLNTDRIITIRELSTDKYLFGTADYGIQMLDMRTNAVSTFSTKEGLSDDIALSIFRDHKNRFWVPTEKGLNLLDFVKGTNTIFHLSNGMPSNGIYSMLEHDGHILAGTGKGLTLIDETEKTTSGFRESSWRLKTYERSIGLPYLDFNANAAMTTRSGQYWWGIVPGVTILDETALRNDSVQTPVQVTGLDILGKPQYFIDPETIKDVDTIWSDIKDTFYLKRSFGAINTDKQKGVKWDSLSATNLPINLSLPPEKNYLRFHFGNFLPHNAGDYRYQYILDGVDEKWSAITDLPYSENYNNISPGYYTFRVGVRKGNGPWSEPSVYRFRVRPPWWFSWWAELLYLLIFVGALRLWVRYRSRRLLHENARLEQKVNQRTAELSNSLENLRQAQRQLVQSEKMASLGELTAGIAHEIQNPLNFVNNFSEVSLELLGSVNKTLDEGNIPDAKEILNDVASNMEKITFHGKRADAIVKGMLLHSRASSGQKIPTDINTLTDEYLRLSYHGLRAKDKSFNAKYAMDFDQKTGEVMLVQQDIGRVLLNLFNNAFYSVTEKKKQLPEGFEPTVTVTTKRKNDSIEIRIRDNGQGISQKVIDKIYQPFFTTKPAGQGTGLGLSLSYDIITKEHGGKIDVVTKENEFTEFIIELPAVTAA